MFLSKVGNILTVEKKVLDTVIDVNFPIVSANAETVRSFLIG